MIQFFILKLHFGGCISATPPNLNCSQRKKEVIRLVRLLQQPRPKVGNCRPYPDRNGANPWTEDGGHSLERVKRPRSHFEKAVVKTLWRLRFRVEGGAGGWWCQYVCIIYIFLPFNAYGYLRACEEQTLPPHKGPSLLTPESAISKGRLVF